MAIESVPTTKSADFISIDKTVIANIDETYRRTLDACSIMEGVKALHFTDHNDDGELNRIALRTLTGSLNEFDAIFDVIGIPGGRHE